jgi:hypothetical protein
VGNCHIHYRIVPASGIDVQLNATDMKLVGVARNGRLSGRNSTQPGRNAVQSSAKRQALACCLTGD